VEEVIKIGKKGRANADREKTTKRQGKTGVSKEKEGAISGELQSSGEKKEDDEGGKKGGAKPEKAIATQSKNIPNNFTTTTGGRGQSKKIGRTKGEERTT